MTDLVTFAILTSILTIIGTTALIVLILHRVTLKISRKIRSKLSLLTKLGDTYND